MRQVKDTNLARRGEMKRLTARVEALAWGIATLGTELTLFGLVLPAVRPLLGREAGGDRRLRARDRNGVRSPDRAARAVGSRLGPRRTWLGSGPSREAEHQILNSVPNVGFAVPGWSPHLARSSRGSRRAGL